MLCSVLRKIVYAACHLQAKGIKKVLLSHLSIVDFMLEVYTLTKNEIATLSMYFKFAQY